MGTDVREELDRLRAEIEKLTQRVSDLEAEVKSHERDHDRAEYKRQMGGF